jgi:hypothetical protein
MSTTPLTDRINALAGRNVDDMAQAIIQTASDARPTTMHAIMAAIREETGSSPATLATGCEDHFHSRDWHSADCPCGRTEVDCTELAYTETEAEAEARVVRERLGVEAAADDEAYDRKVMADAEDQTEFAAGLYPCNICKVPCEDPGAIHLAPKSLLDVEPSPMRDPFAAGALVPDRITTVSGSTYTFTEHALCVGEPHYVTVTCLAREKSNDRSPTVGMRWMVERDDIHLTRGGLFVDGASACAPRPSRPSTTTPCPRGRCSSDPCQFHARSPSWWPGFVTPEGETAMSITMILAVHEMSDQAIREIEAAEHGPILGNGHLTTIRARFGFAPVGSDDFAFYCDLVRRIDLRRAQRRGEA